MPNRRGAKCKGNRKREQIRRRPAQQHPRTKVRSHGQLRRNLLVRRPLVLALGVGGAKVAGAALAVSLQ